MFPLLVFSSMLISSTIRNLGNRFHEKMYFWLPASFVVLLLIGASYPTSQMLTDVIKDLSSGYSDWLRGAKVLVRSFPEDANIYSFSGLNYYVAKEVILGPKMNYWNIAIGKKIVGEMKGFLTGSPDYIKSELKPVAYQPNFRAISYKYGKWEDLTDVIQDWISKEEPFPESLVHEH